MVSIRIRSPYTGKRVTLRGVGFERYHNLVLAQTGLRAVRRRVSRGIGASDLPMPPLTENYKRRKRRSKIRDLWLTGKMILNVSVRWASDRQAMIGLTGRLARVKARANQLIAVWLAWSRNDRRVVVARAEQLFKADVQEVRQQLITGRQRRRRRSSQPARTATLQRTAQLQRVA